MNSNSNSKLEQESKPTSKHAEKAEQTEHAEHAHGTRGAGGTPGAGEACGAGSTTTTVICVAALRRVCNMSTPLLGYSDALSVVL